MSPTRLVLFDIDGTLIHGGPLWRESFHSALAKKFPSIDFPMVTFGGKTDVQICREILIESGLSNAEIDFAMKDVVEDYLEHATGLLRTRSHEVRVLPGVHELLERLSMRKEVLLGLLTGNVRAGAEIKLSAVGLEHYFKFGVFGDDHWDRYELPRIASSRVTEQMGYRFSGKQIVIIGDTIHDVNCGKSIGVRTIAVGTGRNVAQEELLAQGPDFYFRDLSPTLEIIQAVLEDL